MKIKETIERDCCDERRDLKEYNGNKNNYDNRKIYFCIHCGQLWTNESFTDAAGSTDFKLIEVLPAILAL